MIPHVLIAGPEQGHWNSEIPRLTKLLVSGKFNGQLMLIVISPFIYIYSFIRFISLFLPHSLFRCQIALTQVAYSKFIQTPGVYLGLVDIAMLALAKRKRIILLTADKGGLKSPTDILKVLADQLPPQVHLDLSDCKVDEPIDTSNPNVWFLLYCRADFKVDNILSMNHFLPLWHCDQLGKEDWEYAVQTSLHDLSEKNYALATHMQAENIEDEVFESLLEQSVLIESTKAMLDKLNEMKFVAQMVPADGNCGPFSLAALERGKPQELLVGPKLCLKDANDVRQDT